VRAAVRNQEKAELIANTHSIKQLNPGERLTFSIVSDIVATDAYTEAVKGVSGIFHIASPMFAGYEPEKWEDNIINTAIAATLNILDAASNESSVRRVVITSSFFGTIPWRAFTEPFPEVWSTEPTPLPTERPFQLELQAYAASKVYALHATHDWEAHRKHQFDIVNLLPAVVFGKNELVTSTEEFISSGTNQILMKMPLGLDNPLPITSATVHLHDVALAHVRALDRNIPAGSYALNSNWHNGTNFDHTAAIVARYFPRAVEKGILKNSGRTITLPLRFDASKTEEIFGMSFKGYDEQVKSVVEHWLDLYEAEEKLAK
jgi:nucleoside-diphosphate-sugar epimerase